MSILKSLKNIKSNRLIAIPTEKELYNLIINIYISKMLLNMTLYLTSDFLNYATSHIKRIIKQLTNKLDSKTYNFTIKTLTKYIDKSIKCENITESPQSDFFEIACYANLTYQNLIASPINYYDSLNGVIELEHTPSKKIRAYILDYINNYFYLYASNNTIDKLKHFTILTDPP